MRCIAAIVIPTFLWLGCGKAMWAQSGPADSKVDLLQRNLLQLRQEKTVAEVEAARLRQVITRLEAELADARAELARNQCTEIDTEAIELPKTETVQETPIAEESSIEEEDLTDEELGEPPPDMPNPSRGAIDSAAQALYDQSYTQFHENRYQEAEDGFLRFLAKYPETELTDNAHFWIGECRFAQRRFDDALEAFLLTVERFPNGNKVPDAFYKAGRCLEMQGARDRAIETYEQTLRRFPSSAAAISAQERLAALRGD